MAERAEGSAGGTTAGRDAKRDARRTVEPLEPGGEVGETREVGPGGSGLQQPGRAPRTRERRR
jgi:hypothetical protein